MKLNSNNISLSLRIIHSFQKEKKKEFVICAGGAGVDFMAGILLNWIQLELYSDKILGVEIGMSGFVTRW